MNYKSFLDFHESFFENILKIAVFLAITLQDLANLQFSESSYKETFQEVHFVNSLRQSTKMAK